MQELELKNDSNFKENSKITNEHTNTSNSRSNTSIKQKKIGRPKDSALAEVLVAFSNDFPFDWQQGRKKSIVSKSKNERSAKIYNTHITTFFPNSIKPGNPKTDTKKRANQSLTLPHYTFSYKENVENKVAEIQKQKAKLKDKTDQNMFKIDHQSPSNNVSSAKPHDEIEIEEDSTFLTSVSTKQTYKGEKQPDVSQNTSPTTKNSTYPEKLLKYDKDFDVDANMSRVPQGLLNIIDFKHESLVFHAICGSQLLDTPEKHVKIVLSEIKKIFTQTAKTGMITESMYLEIIINTLKAIHGGSAQNNTVNSEIYEKRLEKVNDKISRLKDRYEDKKKRLEDERVIMMDEIENNYIHEATSLEHKWNDEKTRSRFTKPSSKLINLRNEAMVNLKAHRYEEAALIAQEIAKLESEESGEAFKRLNDAYDAAILRLRSKYENEASVAEQSFDMKMRKLNADLDHAERPLISISEKLQNQIKKNERLIEEMNKENEKKTDALKAAINKKLPQFKQIKIEGKLNLPPLPKVKDLKRKSALPTVK